MLCPWMKAASGCWESVAGILVARHLKTPMTFSTLGRLPGRKLLWPDDGDLLGLPRKARITAFSKIGIADNEAK